MEFSEEQLEMVAICSDGLMFKENVQKPYSEELERHRFATIFEPINQNWLNEAPQTDTKSEQDNSGAEKKPSKDPAFNVSINNIEVYLTLKGYIQTS